VNSSGRAQITTGKSWASRCAHAVQYGTGGTVVQVVRRQRIETKRVRDRTDVRRQIEIRDGINEGDDVVARAGALAARG